RGGRRRGRGRSLVLGALLLRRRMRARRRLRRRRWSLRAGGSGGHRDERRDRQREEGAAPHPCASLSSCCSLRRAPQRLQNIASSSLAVPHLGQLRSASDAAVLRRRGGTASTRASKAGSLGGSASSVAVGCLSSRGGF